MKRLAPLVLRLCGAHFVFTTALLAGCSVPFMPTNKPVVPGTNQPVEPLGGVTFKPISAANARLLGGAGAATPNAVATGATKAAAPAAAGGIASDAAMVSNGAGAVRESGGGSNSGQGAFSGNVWGGYSYVYGNYFGYGGGSNTDPMALVSITEAETGGSKGSFQDAIKTVCAPILKAWANDPRLIQSNATLNGDGGAYTNANPDAGMVSKGGFDVSSSTWRLTYTSPARNEMLTFYVGPTKTLVLRMRWAPLSLAPELVTVDSGAAIKKLTAAITDKAFKGEEEKSGNDYFLGTSFEQPQAYNNEYSRTETVYEVSGQGMWNVTLQSILGKLVWQLDYNGQAQPGYGYGGGVIGVGTAVAVAEPAVPMVKFSVLTSPVAPVSKTRPTIAPPALGGEWRESYFSNYANGMVDAQTGAVIRFSRPTRQYYRDTTYASPMPEPMPVETPKPSPSMTPDTSTSPVPSASPDPDAVDGSEGTGEVAANN